MILQLKSRKKQEQNLVNNDSSLNDCCFMKTGNKIYNTTSIISSTGYMAQKGHSHEHLFLCSPYFILHSQDRSISFRFMIILHSCTNRLKDRWNTSLTRGLRKLCSCDTQSAIQQKQRFQLTSILVRHIEDAISVMVGMVVWLRVSCIRGELLLIQLLPECQHAACCQQGYLPSKHSLLQACTNIHQVQIIGIFLKGCFTQLWIIINIQWALDTSKYLAFYIHLITIKWLTGGVYGIQEINAGQQRH